MARPKTPPPRNRAAEAAARGNRLVSFELPPEADAEIDRAAAHLAREQGSCTRAQALIWLLRQGARKLPKDG